MQTNRSYENPAFKLMTSKSNVVTGIIIILFFLAILIRGILEKYKLEMNHRYVIGSLKKKEIGVKGATRYIYQFQYLNKNYERSFSSGIPNLTLKDTIMFFKIYPDDPNIARQLDEVRVPKCLTISDMPKEGWKRIPEDLCK